MWKPIETAPNYKWILCGRWRVQRGPPVWDVFIGRQHIPTGSWFLVPGEIKTAPTHWMELPAPPEVSGPKAGG